jgi:hypothetical protein
MDETQIRTPVLMRLAEQAMSDAAFRRAAADDLAKALADAGYALNEQEMALVMQFRTALRDAGVDVFLKEQSLGDLRHMLADMDADDLTALADRLGAPHTSESEG